MTPSQFQEAARLISEIEELKTKVSVNFEICNYANGELDYDSLSDESKNIVDKVTGTK